MPASGEFKLSISQALTDQLRENLANLTPAPLTLENLALLDKRQGVYQLYMNDALVYVGSAATTLPHRLGKHMRKIAGRRNISIEEVTFTCLYVDEDLTVLAPEYRLIKVFQDEGGAPWNTNGFGNNDPGRRRDESHVSDTHFDSLYPIDLAWPCDQIEAGNRNAAELLAELKQTLPFVLRYENTSRARIEYEEADVIVPSSGMTAEELLELVAEALPGYQVTALPGYVILYLEERSYPSGQVIGAGS
ncbi:MAG TPA: Eco29kI family restriction endonuclease [Solirubrobacterales bacterium]|nr:Eco29kI family restriction endonuclease [Solirubrobacterales bacterium]